MTKQIDLKGILRTFNIRQYLYTFLKNALPQLPGTNWWKGRVLSHLRHNRTRRASDWNDLDTLALLHVFRGNLHDICRKLDRDFAEYNPLVWEMIAIRHAEAHFTEDPPSQDIYRRLDTLERFANFIKNDELLKELQAVKKSMLKDIQTEPGTQGSDTGDTATNLVTRATIELCNFLQEVLPKLSLDWWNEKIINNLPPNEQNVIQRRGINTLDELDSKVLFRVLDANWKDICRHSKWQENDSYYLILAARGVLDKRTTNTEDTYRNLDTLERFVTVIRGSASERLLNDIQSAKEPLLKEMQNVSGSQQKGERLSGLIEQKSEADQRAIVKVASNDGAYRQKITTARPGCIVILADQSESMDESLGNRIKADIVAEAVNTVIAQLITVCTSGEKIKDRCRICVIGYGEEVTYIVNDMVSQLDKSPEPGKGIPTWLSPKASNTTPMTEAFERAYSVVQQSCSEYGQSFPPVVINITDGAPNDYQSTKDAAKKVMELQTTDGNALVFNVHIADSGKEISLPNRTAQFEKEPYAEYAEFLFGISSVLPKPLLARAQSHGFSPLPGSRCLGYNAKPELMLGLLKLGSQPTRKGRREPRPIPRFTENN